MCIRDRVEGNPVFIYLDAFCKQEYVDEFLPDYANLEELKEHYKRGGLGAVKVKKFLNNVMQAELAPIRERRKSWEKRLPDVCLLYTSCGFASVEEGNCIDEETQWKKIDLLVSCKDFL